MAEKVRPFREVKATMLPETVTRSDLEAENARLRGVACLICGRGEPCELDTNKDNDPDWPGSPCTFDPSPIDAARRFMEERDHLQTQVEAWRENTLLAWDHAGKMQDSVVELQAKVKELERHLEMDDPRLLKSVELTATIRAERDRLQERVEEAEESRRADVNEVLREKEAVEEKLRGYKALSERFATSLHYKDVHELAFKDCPYRICQDARAAIDLKPEEGTE